jgi:hypothetical protein
MRSVRPGSLAAAAAATATATQFSATAFQPLWVMELAMCSARSGATTKPA